MSCPGQHYGSRSRPKHDTIHRVDLALTLLFVGWAELGSSFFSCRVSCGPLDPAHLAIYSDVCFFDDDLRNVRRQKARDCYANMLPNKMAELNAKKRENYHRKKAEKQSRFVTCC